MKARESLLWLAAAVLIGELLCWPGTGLGTGLERLPLSGNPAHGRDLFIEKSCISCHAVRGAGGKVGPDLAAALVGKGMTAIAAAIVNHYPSMQAALEKQHAALPATSFRSESCMHCHLGKLKKQNVALPSISPADMDDLITYLLFIDFAREPGSIEQGSALFFRKGCARCHESLSGTPSIAPPLGRAMLAAPPIQVAQEMWNHGTQMNAKMLELGLPRSTFKGHEMADLLAFLGGGVEPIPSHGASIPGDPLAGAELFQSKGCAGCHLAGKSGQALGPDLFNEPWYKTATDIAGAMWNHAPAMWAEMGKTGVTPPRFDDAEMADVIGYLYLRRSESRPGRPKRGRELLRQKHCIDCHEAGGPGPDLTTVKQLDTPIHLAAEMWNHAPRMYAYITDAGLPWPSFAPDDVEDLVSYLRTQNKEKD